MLFVLYLVGQNSSSWVFPVRYVGELYFKNSQKVILNSLNVMPQWLAHATIFILPENAARCASLTVCGVGFVMINVSDTR